MGGQRPRETRGGGGGGCTGRHGGRALRWEGAPSVQWGLGRGAPAGRRLRLGGHQAGMVGRVKELLRFPFSPACCPPARTRGPGEGVQCLLGPGSLARENTLDSFPFCAGLARLQLSFPKPSEPQTSQHTERVAASDTE